MQNPLYCVCRALFPTLYVQHPLAGYLAELETAAWKDARRFRILAVDNNSLSFADYYLQTPSRPVTPSQTRDVQQRQHANISYAITAEDAASFVGDYFVLITNPADGRYSPLMGARRAEVGEEQIRALVLPSVAVSPEAEVRSLIQYVTILPASAVATENLSQLHCSMACEYWHANSGH